MSHLSFVEVLRWTSTYKEICKQQSAKCLIQQIDCSIDKIFDIKKKSLKKLFQEMENFRLKHKNVWFHKMNNFNSQLCVLHNS